ncbi:hypothetical protein TRAPUB_13862 [Trametes pubescens]|uniref:Uncharacterized protein n=1 Tax=Trametes pubescens TaxID=154538 RepID=A0A1M2VQ17_TRAPU|nr:hypothetical protein TRAPUB_13862 [Trametes pubescens]
MSCLVSPIFFVSSACDASQWAEDNISTPLRDISLAQRILFDQLVRSTPQPHIFATLLELEHAADVALDVDSSLLLLEEGSLRLGGMGDVLAVSDINKLSRSLSTSLHKIVKHIEIAVARAVFMHEIMILGLATMERIRVPFSPSGQYSTLGRLARLSVNATDDSAKFAIIEVNHAITLTVALATVSRRFRQTSHADTSCGMISQRLCRSIAPLYHTESRVVSILATLRVLQDLLVEGLGEDISAGSMETRTDDPHPLQFTRIVLQAQRDALNGNLRLLKQPRNVEKLELAADVE